MSVRFSKENGKRGITEVTVSVTPVTLPSDVTVRAEDYDWEKDYAAIGIRSGAGLNREARFTVEQKIYPYIKPNPIILDKNGGTLRVYIDVDEVFGEWEVISWPDWINITSQKWGFGDWYVDITYGPSETPRIGVMEFESTSIRKVYAIQGSLADFTLSYVSPVKVELENFDWGADIIDHYRGEEVKYSSHISYRWYAVFSGEVIRIPERAFKDTVISEVVLPNTVQVIGKEAFNGTFITSINFPDSVRVIEELAFSNSNIGETLDLNNVYSVGRYAFSNNYRIKYVIMNSIIELGNYWLAAFRGDVPAIMSIREIQKSGIDANVNFTDSTFRFNNVKIVGGSHKIICPSNSNYTEWITLINNRSEYNGVFTQEKTLPAVEVSFQRDKMTIPKNGGSMAITVNSSDFDVELIKGEGLDIVKSGNTVTVTSNSAAETDREWVVGFYISGRWYFQTVNQYYTTTVSVEPTNIDIPAAGGLDNIVYIDIQSDGDWEITTNWLWPADWVSIGGSGDDHPERGSGDARRSIVCQSTDVASRMTILEVTPVGGGDSIRLTIRQGTNYNTISVSPTSVTLSYAKKTFYLNVKTNREWEAVATEGITLDKYNGTGNATIAATKTENTSKSEYNGSITIGTDKDGVVVSVKQEAKPTEIWINCSPSSYYFQKGGGDVWIDVTTNGDDLIIAAPTGGGENSWSVLPHKDGENVTGTIKLTVPRNTGSSSVDESFQIGAMVGDEIVLIKNYRYSQA